MKVVVKTRAGGKTITAKSNLCIPNIQAAEPACATSSLELRSQYTCWNIYFCTMKLVVRVQINGYTEMVWPA